MFWAFVFRKQVFSWLHTLFEARNRVGDGAFIASLLETEDTSPTDLMKTAESLLRRVQWSNISEGLLRTSGGTDETFALSESCKLGEIVSPAAAAAGSSSAMASDGWCRCLLAGLLHLALVVGRPARQVGGDPEDAREFQEDARPRAARVVRQVLHRSDGDRLVGAPAADLRRRGEQVLRPLRAVVRRALLVHARGKPRQSTPATAPRGRV